MKTKKGQGIDILRGLVISLVTIAVILVVGFLILNETEQELIEKIDTTSVISEDFTFSTNTSYIGLSYSKDAIELGCTTLRTKGDGTLVGSGNYTCTAGQGILLTNNSGGEPFNNTMTLNYSYKGASYGYNASGDVKNATADIGGWLPIIVIIIIGGVLLTLIALFRR